MKRTAFLFVVALGLSACVTVRQSGHFTTRFETDVISKSRESLDVRCTLTFPRRRFQRMRAASPPYTLDTNTLIVTGIRQFRQIRLPYTVLASSNNLDVSDAHGQRPGTLYAAQCDIRIPMKDLWKVSNVYFMYSELGPDQKPLFSEIIMNQVR